MRSTRLAGADIRSLHLLPCSSCVPSSSLQFDANNLASDVKNTVSHGADVAGEKLHKAGVAIGVAEPTTGEKIGQGITKAVDTVTGNHKI